MVYPDGIWYAQVLPADVQEIVEEHLLNGRVVARLALMKIPAEGVHEPARKSSSDWEV